MTILETLRAPKVLKMSIFDWAVSICLYVTVGLFVFRLQGAIAWSVFFVMWVLFGMLVHVLFRIPTKLGFYAGLNPDVLTHVVETDGGLGAQ